MYSELVGNSIQSGAEYNRAFELVREELLISKKEEVKEILSEEDREQKKEKLIGYIKRILREKSLNQDFAERIYKDTFSFAFIDDLLEIQDLEEINGNAWNDIEIITSTSSRKVDEKFQNPEHAINVVKTMARIGGKTLDEATPLIDSHVGTGLRLTAVIPPVVDRDVGVAFSLRKIKTGTISSSDLVEKYNSYSYDEINFIKGCLKNGISVLFCGATSSGKTADLQAICMDIVKDDNVRIYSIEEDTRELDFILREGEVIKSRVVHTKTRPSKSMQMKDNIDSTRLVKNALRFHPDIIVASEMRSGEAMDAQEAARTGHTVTSTVHAKSVTEAYKRVLTLCQFSGTNLSEDMLMDLLVDAFPICVFKKQLSEDKSRKCMKIFEATGYDKQNKKIIGRILYAYKKERVEIEENKVKVLGSHVRTSYISNKLSQKLFENGMNIENVNKFNPYFNPNSLVDYIEDYIDESEEECVGK